MILKREIGYDSEFTPEIPQGGGRGRVTKVGLAPTLLAMPRVMRESEQEYPAARWLQRLLATDAIFLNPNWASMRVASPPVLRQTRQPRSSSIYQIFAERISISGCTDPASLEMRIQLRTGFPVGDRS